MQQGGGVNISISIEYNDSIFMIFTVEWKSNSLENLYGQIMIIVTWYGNVGC